MRAKPGFYARNHIDKALFLCYSALFTAFLAALLLYSPLFHLIFLSLVLISGGLIPTRREPSHLRSLMYGLYYGCLLTAIPLAALLWAD